MKQRKVAFEVETQFIADGVLQKTPVVGARSHEMTLRDGDEVRLRMKLPDCSKALGKLVKRQRVTVFFKEADKEGAAAQALMITVFEARGGAGGGRRRPGGAGGDAN